MQEVEYLEGKSHKKSQKVTKSVCTPSRAHLHLYRRVEQHCSKWWKWTQTLSRLVKVHVEVEVGKGLEVEVVTGVHVS